MQRRGEARPTNGFSNFFALLGFPRQKSGVKKAVNHGLSNNSEIFTKRNRDSISRECAALGAIKTRPARFHLLTKMTKQLRFRTSQLRMDPMISPAAVRWILLP